MIEQKLIDAYNLTQYHVFDPEIILRIGEHSPLLDSLLDQYCQQEWAFISAFNPQSAILPDDENNLSHEQLKEAVKKYKYFEGEGVGENPPWKPERSLLVIGISKTDASNIGIAFDQNAIVVGRIYSPAELLLLR
jgi:hypothetical protein